MCWRLKLIVDDFEGCVCISYVCVYFDVIFVKEFVGCIIFLFYEKKVFVLIIFLF